MVVSLLSFIGRNDKASNAAVVQPITSTPRATGAAPATSVSSESGPSSAADGSHSSSNPVGSATGTTSGASGASGASGSADNDETASEVSTTPGGSITREPTQEAHNAAKASCKLADLKIEASTDHFSYEEGQRPNFYMKVDNPTNADCKIDLDENVLRFDVYTMDTNELVWSDVDCNDPAETGNQTFKANSECYFKVQWSRTSSAPNACTNREDAPAGDYYLHAVIGKLNTETGVQHSEAVTFNLQ